MGHDGETCQILSLAPPSHVAAVQYFGRHPTRRLPAKCDSCRWDLVRGLTWRFVGDTSDLCKHQQGFAGDAYLSKLQAATGLGYIWITGYLEPN